MKSRSLGLIMCGLSLLLVGLIIGAPFASAELTPVESRLAEIAKQQKAPAIALLEQVVNINSGTMNHAGVKQVADVFDQELKALGFETRWHDLSAVDQIGRASCRERV